MAQELWFYHLEAFDHKVVVSSCHRQADTFCVTAAAAAAATAVTIIDRRKRMEAELASIDHRLMCK